MKRTPPNITKALLRIPEKDVKPASSETIRSIAMTALLLALVYVVTAFIPIPIILPAGGGGYLNLGDAIIAAGSLLIGSPLAAFAAGGGSALADLTVGAGHYAAVSFAIKAAMSLVIVFFSRKEKFFLYVLGVLFASLIMVGGYFVFEYFVISPEYAITFAPFNVVQSGINLILALLLFRPMIQTREAIRSMPEVRSFSELQQAHEEKQAQEDKQS